MNWLWNVLSVFDEWIQKRNGRNCYNYFTRIFWRMNRSNDDFWHGNDIREWACFVFYPFALILLFSKDDFARADTGYICDYLYFDCNNLRYTFMYRINSLNFYLNILILFKNRLLFNMARIQEIFREPSLFLRFKKVFYFHWMKAAIRVMCKY